MYLYSIYADQCMCVHGKCLELREPLTHSHRVLVASRGCGAMMEKILAASRGGIARANRTLLALALPHFAVSSWLMSEVSVRSPWLAQPWLCIRSDVVVVVVIPVVIPVKRGLVIFTDLSPLPPQTTSEKNIFATIENNTGWKYK